MNQTDYEYRGLMAATWDLFRGDTSQWSDRFFYRDMIRQYGQPVLDVGCGTGRLLLDFLSEGVDIDGVDNSPEMLELCRKKAAQSGLQPTLYEQSVEKLELPRSYQLILVPSSSFQLVTDREKATLAMERLWMHLLPGGVLVMPFMTFWTSGDAPKMDWQLVREVTRPEDGVLARKWSRMWFDIETELEHTEDRYELSLNGVVLAQEEHKQSPATRSYTQEQAIRLYQEAGFTDIQVFREFTREPAAAEDKVFSVIGRRP